MKVFGSRTIKTAVSATAGSYLAYILGLDFYMTAGIIAILSVQNTRRKSIDMAISRIVATLIGLLVGSVTFFIVGYNVISFGIFLLILIPVTVRYRAKEGIVPSAVLVTHIYSAQSIAPAILLNEIGLLIVGVAMALLANLYMPNIDEEIREQQRRVEEQFTTVLYMMGKMLKSGQQCYNPQMMRNLETLLKEGSKLSYLNMENTIITTDPYYVKYFVMRNRQFEILERLISQFKYIEIHSVQADTVSDFLDSIACDLHEKNTAESLMDELAFLRTYFENMPLPTTRKEFETRAILYQFVNEIDRFLEIKNDFAKKMLN